MKNIDNIGNILHVDKVNYAPFSVVKQEDNLVLTLELYKNGTELDVTGQIIELAAKRADNVVVKQIEGFTIDKNKLTITLKNNIIAAPGIVQLELIIKDSAGAFTTSNFSIRVNEKILGETSLNASDNIAALEKVKNEFVDSSNKLKNEFVSTSEKLKTDFKATGDKQIASQKSDYDSLKKVIINENQAALLQDDINKNKTEIETIKTHVPVWQEQVGQNGNLTINDGFEDTLKNLVIKGKTVGGYNSETGQSDSIVSSGEVEGNKIIIKSIGKNLLDVNKKENQTIGTLIYTDGTIYDSPNRDYYYTSWIKCEKATKYTVSGLNSKVRIVSYDSNKNFKSGGEYGTVSVVKGDYIRVGYIIAYMNNVMLEESTLATEYVDYVEDRKENLLPFTGGLRGLTQYKDSIDFEAGKILKLIDKKVINGSEEWVRELLNTTNCIQFYTLGWSNERINDTLKNITNNEMLNDIEGIRIDGDIAISVLKTKLETPDVLGLKKWLQANPITIYQALQTPIIHNIEKMTMPQYAGTTHIIQENEVAGDISCKAKISLSAQGKRLKEENKSLKSEVSVEQNIQDNKITTTMLANTELFEILIGLIPMKAIVKGGEIKMVEVYVTLIIQGDKTLEQVPSIIRSQVEAKLKLLGIII